jgi:hypothetical protein
MLARLITVALFAAGALGAAPLAAPTPQGPHATGIIELPTFVVTDSRELPAPESWRYAQIPGLEVLSTVSERDTRRFVVDFMRLRQVLEIVWPAITRGPPAQPGMLILCGPGNAFDSFMPAGPVGAAARPTSVFLQEADRAAIVVDFVKERFDDRVIPAGTALPAAPLPAEPVEDAPPAGAGFMNENDPFREFYLQYFRSVIRRGGTAAPPWLEEGLVQVLASVQFSKEEIALGRLQDGAGGQRPDEFTIRLARQPLLDPDRMFAAVAPEGGDALTYSPQCYAFVHLCLYGKKGIYQAPLEKLVRRAATEPVTEKVFQECFGLSYAQMGTLLRSHISYAAHQYIQLRAARGSSLLADVPAFTVREATQAEIGRIKGDAYRMGGHAGRARLALIAPYIRGEPDAALLASLGLFMQDAGDRERGRKFLEASVAAGVDRPLAYLQLARARLADAKAALAPGATLETKAVETACAPLRAAAARPPALPEIYELLGELRAQSGAAISEEEMKLLFAGAQQYRDRPRLIYLAAAHALRRGENTPARALIEHGLSLARGTERAQHFQALQAQLR